MEKIKPFKNVGNKFKVQWAEFDEVEYNSTTPTSNTMEFIDCLVKKKGDWMRTPDALKVLHRTFVSLSKTSPEVFLEDGKEWQPEFFSFSFPVDGSHQSFRLCFCS